MIRKPFHDILAGTMRQTRHSDLNIAPVDVFDRRELHITIRRQMRVHIRQLAPGERIGGRSSHIDEWMRRKKAQHLCAGISARAKYAGINLL